MVNLTQEQKNLIVLIGKPDDGSEDYVVADCERITNELISLGFVHCTGKDKYDLTDDGERLYRDLTANRVS